MDEENKNEIIDGEIEITSEMNEELSNGQGNEEEGGKE